MQASSQPRSRLTHPERRTVILDAALARFAADGYAQTSIRDIAEGSGVTKPVIYDHFESKQALYVALVDRERDRFFASVLAGFEPDSPLDERFAQLATATIGHVRRHTDAARLLFRAPEGDAIVLAAHERLRQLSREMATKLILADPAFEASPGLSLRTSAALHADLQGALLERLAHWALDHPRLPARALADVFVDVLWNGLSR